MCLLAVHLDGRGRSRVLHLREEFLDRGAAGVAPCGAQVLAPRDRRHGGAWIALNTRARFVAALMNRPVGGRDDTKRSRGEIPLLLAGCENLEQARRTLRATEIACYNPFMVVLIDADRAHAFDFGPEGGEIALAEGWSVLGSCGLARAADPWPRLDRLKAGLDALGALRAAPHPRETALLSTHDADWRRALCLHRRGYGTRSADRIDLGASGLTWWRMSDAPCRGSWRRVISVRGS